MQEKQGDLLLIRAWYEYKEQVRVCAKDETKEFVNWTRRGRMVGKCEGQ